MLRRARVWCSIFVLLASAMLSAGEYRGVVKLGTLPVPGATVTAHQGDKTVAVLTDAQGAYVFPNLDDGAWAFTVEMRGFGPARRDIEAPGAVEWSLTILPLAKIAEAGASAEVRAADSPKVEIKRPANAPPAATNTTSGFQQTEVSASNVPVAAAEVSSEVARRAADGFLVNGSVNNAASSPFSQLPAFGNNRAPGRWRYNGNLGFMMDNSATDARPFSLTGQDTARPAYTRFTGMATLGGPI
ncbi:MAG: carboxypeptidase-like regulatory domain-containing protein, partial [Candidatus Solibacter sp.]|nr:carboxypeptidase-like regulatory domain-containing protein [Candidatus Solibacter sp.]